MGRLPDSSKEGIYMHILTDLDDFLVVTGHLEVFRKTGPGREYLLANINDIPTELTHPRMAELMNYYHRNHRVSVITNSPAGYSQALLAKHGFDENISVYANANKPNTSSLDDAINDAGSLAETCVVLGDSAKDVVAAHLLGICSIAAPWGDSTREQLEKAQASLIADDFAQIERGLIRFEGGTLQYVPKINIPNTFRLAEKGWSTQVQLDIHQLGAYFPWSRNKANMDVHSTQLLDIKFAKDYISEEVFAGVTRDYFAGGQMRQGSMIRTSLESLMNKAAQKIEEMGLEGPIYLAEAPNSLPDYCYRSDILREFTLMLDDLTEGTYAVFPARLLLRRYPKESAHSTGNRGASLHYSTMAINLCPENRQALAHAANIVIIDDIMTSGTTLKCNAHLIRSAGFEGYICGLALGKTAGV